MTENQTVEVTPDWKRIASSLRQGFRRQPSLREKIPPAIEILQNISTNLGVQSRGRRGLRNIGMGLVQSKGPLEIMSPICLSVPPAGTGEPAPAQLVEKHIEFLSGLGDCLPRWKLVCLFPPPEKEDAETEAFIRTTCALTKARHAGDERIGVAMMVNYAPGMISMEETVIQEICSSPFLLGLSERLTRARARYYHSIGIKPELWPRRTRRTMAQYIILGRLASMHGMIMCNHTSANIQCAQYASGGVLHNPVGFR